MTLFSWLNVTCLYLNTHGDRLAPVDSKTPDFIVMLHVASTSNLCCCTIGCFTCACVTHIYIRTQLIRTGRTRSSTVIKYHQTLGSLTTTSQQTQRSEVIAHTQYYCDPWTIADGWEELGRKSQPFCLRATARKVGWAGARTWNPDTFARAAAHTIVDCSSLTPHKLHDAIEFVFETTHTTLRELKQGHLWEKKNSPVFWKHCQPFDAWDVAPCSFSLSKVTFAFKWEKQIQLYSYWKIKPHLYLANLTWDDLIQMDSEVISDKTTEEV